MPATPRGERAVLSLKFVSEDIGGYNVKVPVMVNLQDIDDTTELTFAKADVDRVMVTRSSPSIAGFLNAAKARKII